jgi:hypothetical protein
MCGALPLPRHVFVACCLVSSGNIHVYLKNNDVVIRRFGTVISFSTRYEEAALAGRRLVIDRYEIMPSIIARCVRCPAMERPALSRRIHTYHAVPMPFLCHAVPLRV